MKLTLKNYKFFKLKKYFRKNLILYIYNTKTKKKNIENMQYYKKFNFNCHQISNSLMKKCLKHSTYENYNIIINGLIIINEFDNTINQNLKEFNNKNILLAIKINNRIYSGTIYKNNQTLNYKKNSLNFLKLLKKNYKIIKKFRNNVI